MTVIVEEHVPQVADDHLVAGRRDGKDDHRRADEDVQLEVVDEGGDLIVKEITTKKPKKHQKEHTC